MINHIDYAYKPENDLMVEKLQELHDKAEKLGFVCVYFEPQELQGVTFAGCVGVQEHLIKSFYDFIKLHYRKNGGFR